jgi:hypothetical protein
MVAVDVTDRLVCLAFSGLAMWMAWYLVHPNETCKCVKQQTPHEDHRIFVVFFLMVYAVMQASDAFGIRLLPPGTNAMIVLATMHIIFLIELGMLLYDYLRVQGCTCILRAPQMLALMGFGGLQLLIMVYVTIFLLLGPHTL